MYETRRARPIDVSLMSRPHRDRRATELKRLSDAHQMFLLRDALSKYPHRSDFYAGEVACAFNDTATCEDNFRKVLATTPK